MAADPVCTDPDKYQVIFENDRVRVLEYRDLPGGKTRPHQHPDSVMYTLSAFQRRLHAGQGARDVVMEPGRAHWLPSQTHAGENIGTRPRMSCSSSSRTQEQPGQLTAAAPATAEMPRRPAPPSGLPDDWPPGRDAGQGAGPAGGAVALRRGSVRQ
jgi:hypothetical protein